MRMVGAISVVGSSVVDSHTGPCLCVDAWSSSASVIKKPLPWRPVGSLDLSSSFVGSSRRISTKASRNSKKQQRKSRSLVIVDELAGQYEDSFEDVKAQILNYFTYKAVRTVMNQLYEMNPTQYRWMYDFVVSNKPGDGKRFIRTLAKEKQELAERVMVTRLHLYAKWIKKWDHSAMYKEISDQNLELMRERLLETVIWPSDDTNTEKIG
ncbi:hypothetical protein RJ640_027722 [Escallonia rubra]|uniref:Chaperonin-like RbcX protein n=1 Tax=Escallonia rubra TaxID=112253 RepID=A0AA88U0W5_9ASTE|nr:hypothetical protein RJ640_027722 [Escallonia rubra]